MNLRVLSIGMVIFLLTACKVTRNLDEKEVDYKAEISEIISKDSIFATSHTGLYVKEVNTGQIIFEHKSDQYFTPASNTKLLTFYTCIKVLDDRITGLKIYENQDSTIIWGTGDASFLNPFLFENDFVSERLRSADNQIYFSTSNFQDHHYGSGWSWDDFNYAYQVDKHALPMYGNLVNFSKKDRTSPFYIYPGYFGKLTAPNLEIQSSTITREEHSNIFKYDYYKLKDLSNLNRNVPFIVSDELQAALLEEHLGRSVELINANHHIGDAEKLKSADSDSLYRLLLQPSDNFVAEQLLLNCSSELFDRLNTRKIINWATKNILNTLPHEFQWVDGSGLSRYNMTTPGNMVHLLELIYKEVDQERLFELLPTGGVSGTIRRWYAAEQPFIHAKTGSLRNNHSLSGYLIGDSGKVYVFSFMNSNYLTPNNDLKKGMDRVLRILKSNL